MKNIRKIIALSKPLYRLTLLLSLLVLVMSVLQQVQPFFIKFIVDNIQKEITTHNGNLQTVSLLMLGLLVVNLLSSLLDSLSMRFGDYINSRLRRFLTEKFYSHVFTLPQKYFDSEISGKILNQLIRGIQSIQDFMGMFTNFVLPAIFQSIFTVGILFYYSRPIGLLAFLIFPAYILMSNYSTKKWGKEEVKKNRLEDIARGRISEVISNIRLVRGFMAQALEWKLVSKILAKVNEIYDRQSTTYHIINFIREFSLELVLVLISLITFSQTFTGKLTLGEMVLILQLINLMRRPLFAMSFILERIQAAESGSKEYFEVMDLESEEKLNLLPLPPVKIIKPPSLRFDKVSFRYSADGQEVLHNLSFSTPGRQTIALVGHSGAGKSTIINLVLKFYQPASGEIYLNNQPYSRLTHQQIRSHISLVFQDNELFSTTVRENVSYGLTKASDEAIISALKKANAYDFVRQLPGKLDAEIGERGVKLSGGQKQRIQIARAIMRNSPILILDEATSNLDSQSESTIQSALENLMKDKLVIIIAHRFSTIQAADQILVIDEGKLVNVGTPGELAQKPGVYSELLRYQIAGNQKLLAKYDLH
ncbi:MAG: ABC transporter ATP-binding protein [Candidatus Beckwithbacteria bacterium]|nr:ABC transporter ATP-binding protein [Candidatus Beckwithbacteria bacterium]